MKTRREFFKTLAGSMAVVAACVIAPKSLVATESKYDLPSKSCHGYKGYITSGYMHVEERLDNIDSWINITETGEGISQRRSPLQVAEFRLLIPPTKGT